MKFPRWLQFVTLAAALSIGSALARVPFWGDTVSQAADTPVERLKPGQWVWSPGESPQGPVVVVVNLDRQAGYAYRNGVLIGYTSVSSGKRGHDTPTGVFHTLQKDKDHRSSKYNSAPMPYTQRLTWDGVALHAGGLPGYPSSHGCVHLPSAFAEKLFAVSPLGMTVVVARGAATPVELSHPLPISPVDPQTGELAHEPSLTGDEAFRWTPEAALDGPVSLVLSRADERLVVLRAGVEIARAKVAIADRDQPFGTHAFVAHEGGSAAGAGFRWVGVPVPGHAQDAGRDLRPEDLARARLPRAFVARLDGLLQEGSTLVVTDAPILPHTTGTPLTVVTNQPPEAI